MSMEMEVETKGRVVWGMLQCVTAEQLTHSAFHGSVWQHSAISPFLSDFFNRLCQASSNPELPNSQIVRVLNSPPRRDDSDDPAG